MDKKPWVDSRYYEVTGKRLRCPFCGTEMDFNDPIYHEYSELDWYWNCRECGLELGNLSLGNYDIWLSDSRKRYRALLKKKIETLRDILEMYKERLEKYGKFMTPEEKTKLLAEELEK